MRQTITIVFPLTFWRYVYVLLKFIIKWKYECCTTHKKVYWLELVANPVDPRENWENMGQVGKAQFTRLVGTRYNADIFVPVDPSPLPWTDIRLTFTWGKFSKIEIILLLPLFVFIRLLIQKTSPDHFHSRMTFNKLQREGPFRPPCCVTIFALCR